jgi:hypothetical protein
MGAGKMRRAFLVAALATASAGFRTPDDESKPYPRALGEVKAMVQLLAPKKGTGASTPNEFLSHLAQYRYLCGVPYETLSSDAHDATLANHASLICSKLNLLTHTPARPAGMADAEWELCRIGAAECNLYMGQVDPAACVDGWMDDSDPSNIDRVGHRRWCLNPSMQRTGFGSAGNFAAMYAFDRSLKEVPDWDFVAFPPRGYMPSTFFGNRHAWSVCPNPAKYTLASAGDLKVTIQPVNPKFDPAGPPLKLDFFKVDTKNFGTGPAIIFRPANFSAAQEAIYAVEIKGLKSSDSGKDSIRYFTHFISLQRVPEGPEGSAAVTKYFQNRLASVQSLDNGTDQVEVLGELAEHESLRLADMATRTAIPKALAELLKDPSLKREYEAAQRYRPLALSEQKAGKSKSQLGQVAVAYREFSLAFKETRAGKKAAEDFERLKAQLQ